MKLNIRILVVLAICSGLAGIVPENSNADAGPACGAAATASTAERLAREAFADCHPNTAPALPAPRPPTKKTTPQSTVCTETTAGTRTPQPLAGPGFTTRPPVPQTSSREKVIVEHVNQPSVKPFDIKTQEQGTFGQPIQQGQGGQTPQRCKQLRQDWLDAQAAAQKANKACATARAADLAEQMKAKTNKDAPGSVSFGNRPAANSNQRK